MPQNELNNKQIDGIQRLLSLLDPDTLTKEQFTEAFKRVIDHVKKIDERNKKEIQALKTALENFNNKLKDDTGNDIKGLKAEVNSLVTEKLSNIDLEHKTRLGNIDFKMANIRNGKDADEERIIKKVGKNLLREIPSVKKILKGVKREKLRDALEGLEGDERLELGVIRGLRSKLRRLEERPVGKTGGIGDANIKFGIGRLTKKETPSGLINGTNKVYTVENNIHTILSFAINGMIITDDEYTISGKTITFATAIPADLSGKSFRISYI